MRGGAVRSPARLFFCRHGQSLVEVVVVLAIALTLTSLTGLAVWRLTGSSAAQDRAALRKAESCRDWLKARIVEAARFQRSFSIHLPAASGIDVLEITWNDTLEKDVFSGGGVLYFLNYANESATVSFMPQWFRMTKGFTLKLTCEGKLKEPGFRFLVVSPEARVRLSDTAPSH